MDKAQVDILPTNPKTATIFAAITIPNQAQLALQHQLKRFRAHADHLVPARRWHLTLAYVGKITTQPVAKFAKDISLPFVPTVSITHIGLGKQKDQLWAYIHTTPLMQELRHCVIEHLATIGLTTRYIGRAYVPHIRIAGIKADAGASIADAAVPITFPVREVILFRSHHDRADAQYEKITSARITA